MREKNPARMVQASISNILYMDEVNVLRTRSSTERNCGSLILCNREFDLIFFSLNTKQKLFFLNVWWCVTRRLPCKSRVVSYFACAAVPCRVRASSKTVQLFSRRVESGASHDCRDKSMDFKRDSPLFQMSLNHHQGWVKVSGRPVATDSTFSS